jgi:uncharacterized membrane protein
VTVPAELLLLWMAFAGTHIALSSGRIRPRLIAGIGAQPFLGVYSLVALALFVPLVRLYFRHRHAGPVLWTSAGPPAGAVAANHVLMAAALVLVVAAVLPGSAAPSAMGAGAAAPLTARGTTRVTRHPLFAGLALFGIAHLLVNGALGDVVFFGGFPLYGWIGARHQDARLARQRPGYAAFVAETSFVPFAAIVRGRQRLVAGELPWAAIAGGLAATVALRHWHGTLFG